MLNTRTLAAGLLAGCVAFTVGMPVASAQNADTSKDANQKATQLKTVVVTGTRGLPRTEADSMSPVDVLSPQDLKSTGATDLSSALRTLLPSFNFPQPSITDATDATQPAQLRGLSPDETLVLVNGKRMHTTSVVNINGSLGRGSSPVDLNAIPINAIDHIEVLRDGAAAQYGSDAIAGVINIILKGGADHGSANVTYGEYDKGDGQTVHGGADGGFKLGSKGWVHLSANFMHQDPTNRAGPDIRYPSDPTYNTVTFHYGLPLTKAKQAAINAQYDLSPNAQLYAYSLFNKRNVSAGGFFRSLSQYSSSFPGAVATYPNGYLPMENSSIRDDQEVIGVRGMVGKWNYDISYGTGGNHWKLHTSNTYNYVLDPNSPTSFYIGTLSNRDNIVNADFNREFDVPGLSNPVTLAWGLEYRTQKFEIKHGDPASYACSPTAPCGAQVYSGYTPLDAGSHSRHNTAEYIDLESDLTNNFTAGLAVRHENYSDFGGTTSWKLSGRYAFNETVALRATASTGFRAPSLQQEYFSNTVTLFPAGSSTPVNTRTFPVSDPAAIALGAQPLKPEKSHSYSMGLVITPSNGLYTTLDVYDIRINDRIILSGSLSGTAVENYLTSVGITGVGGGLFFNNAVDTRTRGADLVVTYPIDLSHSTLKLTGGMNYNKTTILSIAPNPPQLGLAGLTLPIVNSEEKRFLTVSSPRTKAFVGGVWSMDHWSVHAQATRYGQWTDARYITQTYSSKTLLDASVDYTLNNWKFTLGSNNLTNVYPDKVQPPGKTYNTILPYPETAPFGFSGRYVYGTVGYSW
jgi:iron complex outermembrane recepter protein